MHVALEDFDVRKSVVSNDCACQRQTRRIHIDTDHESG
jgi:hypothetical protein